MKFVLLLQIPNTFVSVCFDLFKLVYIRGTYISTSQEVENLFKVNILAVKSNPDWLNVCWPGRPLAIVLYDSQDLNTPFYEE